MHSSSVKDIQFTSAQSVTSSTNVENYMAPVNLSVSVTTPVPTSVYTSTSADTFSSMSVRSSSTVPSTLHVPVKASVGPNSSSFGIMKSVNDTICNNRPPSPATKQRIEANRLRALQKKSAREKLKCEVNTRPTMSVSSSSADEQILKSSTQSDTLCYTFTTANKSTVNVDEMNVHYVEKNTDIFKNDVSAQTSASILNPSVLPITNAGTDVTNAIKLQNLPVPNIRTTVSVKKRSID